MPIRCRWKSLWPFVLALWLALGSATARAQPQNVDPLVSKTFGGLRLNRATSTFDTVGTIKNLSTGSTLAAPLSLIVTSISNPTVTLANRSDMTPDGHSFVDIPVPGGTLAPGGSVQNVLLQFYNPNRVSFTFTCSLLAAVNEPPHDTNPPTVAITSPANGAVFSGQPITVTGTVNDSTAHVMVNGVPATISGGIFTARSVPLPRDGMQTVTAIATDPAGNTSQASVTVALDTTPPSVVIDSPPTGYTTSDTTAAIAGLVSDVISPNPTVTVNGRPATVMNGYFIAMGVPLNPGANLITAAARDGVGNIGTATITLNRSTQPGLQLSIVSGQAQAGLVGTRLAQPLVVRLVDGNGDPVANRDVNFAVSRGDGVLRNNPLNPSQEGQRSLFVFTDANGQAAVLFTLGSRSGAGSNRVRAAVSGGLSFVEFCATGLSGTPDRISIIPMSNQQTGVVDRPLPAPFAAVVSDRMGNPVTGAAVDFRVSAGGGSFAGSGTTRVITGADGIARAVLTLGPEPGTQNNQAKAAFVGQTSPPAEFAASARVPGPPGSTLFCGIVLDNEEHPLANALALIQGTTRQSVTGADGRFQIANVPPGAQRLFIDGSQISDAQGRIFPNLEFNTNIVSGVKNSLATPIYLPPLTTDSRSLRTITGPVTSAVVLQMPGVPESTLTLLPGTIVSNSNGPAGPTNPITVRLSRVNSNRVPMPPPNGSVFLLAGTVQPSGIHFDPPAAVCSPNTGLAPGAQADVYTFDHDLGQFVSIGLATVTEDGSRLCSNPGFGIHKAGWWGFTPPPPPNTQTDNCQVNLTSSPIRFACVNQDVMVTANTNTGDTVTWAAPGASSSSMNGNQLTVRYDTPGIYAVAAVCDQTNDSVSITVLPQITEAQLKRTDEDEDVFASGMQMFGTGDKVDGRAQFSEPPAESVGESVKWVLKFGGAVMQSGVGDSFSGEVVDQPGMWSVTFYCDSNDDGQFNEGTEQGETTEFKVVDPTVQTLTVATHVDVPFTGAQVDALLAQASDLLQKKDTKDDVRCIVKFQRQGPVLSFGTHGSPTGTPPAFVANPVELDAVFQVHADVKIVHSLFESVGSDATDGLLEDGRVEDIGVKNIIVTSDASAAVWAHEFGHTLGLMHMGQSDHVMSADVASGPGNVVTSDECDTFRQGAVP